MPFNVAFVIKILYKLSLATELDNEKRYTP